MKKANISINNENSGLSVVERMEYEKVEAVYDAMNFAFYKEEDDEHYDDILHSLLILFFSSVGWTFDEFIEQYEERNPCTCGNCDLDELPEIAPETKKFDKSSN